MGIQLEILEESGVCPFSLLRKVLESIAECHMSKDHTTHLKQARVLKNIKSFVFLMVDLNKDCKWSCKNIFSNLKKEVAWENLLYRK